MDEKLKYAVTLSIISASSKLLLWDRLKLHPEKIPEEVNPSDLKVQEIICRKYSNNADKAAFSIIENCIKNKIKIITIWDTGYPELLREIHNPPLVLYVKGALLQNKMISIVGTRNSDRKAEEVAERISECASLMGCTVVSGMALGIDRYAHLGALKAGGCTLAVLPGGVDIVYPYKNSDIYKTITESETSAVISEYPPGIGEAQKWTFAKRNRIISGLSEVVIIVQAPVKSGAMITARYAIEHNRELLVCPGNSFDENYSGCHQLIKQGAVLFSDMKDLFPDINLNCKQEKNNLHDLKHEKKNVKNVKQKDIDEDVICDDNLSGLVENTIYREIQNREIDIDEFIRSNDFSAEEVNRGITFLEIAGRIERRGNKLFKS